jgi:hypothetical protein
LALLVIETYENNFTFNFFFLFCILAKFTNQEKAATNVVQDKVLIVSQPPVLFSMDLSPDFYI